MHLEVHFFYADVLSLYGIAYKYDSEVSYCSVIRSTYHMVGLMVELYGYSGAKNAISS